MRTSIFLTITALALIGCSNVAPTANMIAPPPKSAPVAPVAAKVKKEIVAVKESNQVIEHSLDAAIDQLSRLQQQKTASEKELDILWDTLTAVQDRVVEQWLLLGESEKTIDELNIKANTADVENVALRDSLSEANARLTAAAEWHAKHAKKVAVYEWIANKAWWILGIAIVCGIAYLALKFFLPPRI